MAQPAIIEFLKRKDNGVYSAKLFELREAVTDWLSYTTETFPHYTRHTVGHSEEIIVQLSNIMFEDNKAAKPAFDLGAVEAYILCAAAYLHDAGMVCSDQEKKEIMSSQAWSEWLSENEIARASLQRIESARSEPDTASVYIRNFSADLELRRLVADFVRRFHHERAASLVEIHQSALGRCGFDDPALTNAIATVCRGHGLTHEQLDDDIEFPTSTQIRGENVNIRLLAILFRLGDLLDVSHQRACPLLLNAANPIPANSVGHWEQYAAIQQKLFTNEEIRIIARCDTAEQQRILSDWCNWIVEEVQAAPALLARSKLHKKWRPPHARVGYRASATIDIRPSKNARYKPVDWKFQIAPEQAIIRLTRDAYRSPMVFIRELIQNSLDAVRCRMYAEFRETGLPSNPSMIPDSIRDMYKVSIEIGTPALPAEDGSAHGIALSISDNGMGMNEEIIVNNLLQIGRSYYQTEKFKKQYGFSPNSAFGIGFLSVFNVSDSVTIKTRHHESPPTSGGLRLTLTGLRNSIAVEEVERKAPGTSITVNLRQDIPLKPGELTEFIKGYCCSVEIPISIVDFGSRSELDPDDPQSLTFSVPDVENDGSVYELRRYERVNNHGKVEIYVLARRGPDGSEDWTKKGYYKHSYREKNPHAEYIPLPKSRVSISGVLSGETSVFYAGRQAYTEPLIEHIDIRDRSFEPTLSRDSLRIHSNSSALASLRNELWKETLNTHLADAKAAGRLNWKYIQQLSDSFPFSRDFWFEQPDSIAWNEHGDTRVGSAQELLSRDRIVVAMHPFNFRDNFYRRANRADIHPQLQRLSIWNEYPCAIRHDDLVHSWSREMQIEFCAMFAPEAVLNVNSFWTMVTYSKHPSKHSFDFGNQGSTDRACWRKCHFSNFGHQAAMTLEIGLHEEVLISADTPLERLLTNLQQVRTDFSPRLSRTLLDRIRGAATYKHNKDDLAAYVERWNKIANLPENLRIQEVDMFVKSVCHDS